MVSPGPNATVIGVLNRDAARTGAFESNDRDGRPLLWLAFQQVQIGARSGGRDHDFEFTPTKAGEMQLELFSGRFTTAFVAVK